MISVRGLTKSYFGVTVVDNVSFNIKKGEVFGFLGQNGAGKTTTIKMLVGLSMPDAGEILIDNQAPDSTSGKEKIGFMPEAPYFYDRLTGLEFINFCAELFSKKPILKDNGSLLKMVGIFDAKDLPIKYYSKGMRQRLGFAQALVNDPEYIFLDEPLDGLDPIGRKEIKEIIKRLKKEGKTIFFNSHILYDTEELCDEVGVIHKGKLLYKGSVKEFCAGLPLEKRFVELIERHGPVEN